MILIDTLLIALILITIIVMFIYWYSRYTAKSAFSVDENNNHIPDSWEKKFGLFFKLKNMIILILGVLIGYLLNHSTFF